MNFRAGFFYKYTIMALKSVDVMVRNRLQFVPAGEWEELIEDFETEQMYYLNTYLDPKKEPADIEDESKWLGVERLLLAECTTYELLTRQIMTTLGGDAADSESSPGSNSKMVKSAKADVVEAEFEYAKAEDGRTLAVKASQLVVELRDSICRYAQALGFYLPGFCKNIPTTNPQPPFIVAP